METIEKEKQVEMKEIKKLVFSLSHLFCEYEQIFNL